LIEKLAGETGEGLHETGTFLHKTGQ
jgi:hypothetical protein